MGGKFEGSEEQDCPREYGELGPREGAVVEVAQVALVAAGLHRDVDAFAAFVGADEERADHVADDAALPAPIGGGRAGRRGGAGGAGTDHAGGFIGEHGQITVHEGDDGDHEAREAEAFEAFEEVVERGGEDEEGGGLHRDPRFQEDGGEGDEPFAAEGEGDEAKIDGGDGAAFASEEEGQRSEGEGEGDEGAADKPDGPDAGGDGAGREGQPAEGEGEVGALGQEADAQDEGDDEEKFEARVSPVEGAFAGDVAVEVQGCDLRAARRATPMARVATKTMPTPMRPERTTVVHWLSMPGTV